MIAAGVKSRIELPHTCDKMNKIKECKACLIEFEDIKSDKALIHTCKQYEEMSTEESNDQLNEFKKMYPMAEWGEKDGIVWVRIKKEDPITAWSKSRPGIIAQVDTFEEAAFQIKELIDSIEGWEE
jgi:hypothetical protein